MTDLRGVFIRGTGTSASIGGETYSGGALGAKQADATSKNGLTATSSQDWHNHTTTDAVSSLMVTSTFFSSGTNGAVFQGSNPRSYTGGAQPNVYTTINAGDSETRPANISLTPCIWTVSNPATMLVGSVTSNASGALRIESAFISCSSSSSATSLSSSNCIYILLKKYI